MKRDLLFSKTKHGFVMRIKREDRIQFLVERIFRLKSQMPENRQRMIDFELLVRVLHKIQTAIVDDELFSSFCSRVDKMLDLISEDPAFAKATRKEYFKLQEDFFVELRVKHHLVRSGYYLAIFLPLSLALGPALGVILNKMGLGLAILILLGIGAGSYLDQQAKKHHRQY